MELKQANLTAEDGKNTLDDGTGGSLSNEGSDHTLSNKFDAASLPQNAVVTTSQRKARKFNGSLDNIKETGRERMADAADPNNIHGDLNNMNHMGQKVLNDYEEKQQLMQDPKIQRMLSPGRYQYYLEQPRDDLIASQAKMQQIVQNRVGTK